MDVSWTCRPGEGRASLIAAASSDATQLSASARCRSRTARRSASAAARCRALRQVQPSQRLLVKPRRLPATPGESRAFSASTSARVFGGCVSMRAREERRLPSASQPSSSPPPPSECAGGGSPSTMQSASTAEARARTCLGSVSTTCSRREAQPPRFAEVRRGSPRFDDEVRRGSPRFACSKTRSSRSHFLATAPPLRGLPCAR